jgi:DNA-binding transcriptional LysR family regulator
MKLDVRAAIQFVAVAEELSFRRAAERLHVAQPWLSTRIRNLEDQLGFALFVRSTRTVELTDTGRLFLKDASALAAAARAVDETAQMLRNEQYGRLRIGVPPYHASLRQKSALIRQFMQMRPHASVELEVGWSPNLLSRLIDRSLDLAFILDPATDSMLECLTIGLAYPVLVMPSGTALAKRANLRLKDLQDREVAVFTRGLNPALYDKIFGPFEAAGAKLLQVPEFGDLVVHRKKPAFPLFATLDWTGNHATAVRGVAMRRIADHQPQIPLQLVRQKGHNGRLQDELWQLARSLDVPS